MMIDRLDDKIFITLDESEAAVLDDFGLVTIRDVLQGFFDGRKRVAQQKEMQRFYESFGKLNTRDQHSVRTIIASATSGEPGRTSTSDRTEGSSDSKTEPAIGS